MNLSEEGRSDQHWIMKLLNTEFFGKCMNHENLRKNERVVFCIDCILVMCKHCVLSEAHTLHRRLQICKYVYQDVLRLHHIQPYFDCSEIQTYKINGEMAIHLRPRPQVENARPSTKSKYGASCVTCKRYIQDHPNQFCSISCKISNPLEKYEFCFYPRVEQSGSENEHSTQEASFEEKKSSTSSLTNESEDSETKKKSMRTKKRTFKRKGNSRRSHIC